MSGNMDEDGSETMPMLPSSNRPHGDILIPIDVTEDKTRKKETPLGGIKMSKIPFKESSFNMTTNAEKNAELGIVSDSESKTPNDNRMHFEGNAGKIQKTKSSKMQSHQKLPKKTNVHLAAELGNAERLKELIAKNQSALHSQDDSCCTTLHMAAKELHYDCCEILLEASNKEINMRDGRGNSSLMLSISSEDKSIKIVKLLLSKEAKINCVNHRKCNAFHIAAEKGNAKILELLLEKDNSLLESVNSANETPLHLAVRNISSEACNTLLAAVANIEAKDNCGNTPLHWAARKSSIECMKSLISQKCEVNCIDKEGNTPLHLVCSSEQNKVNLECFEELQCNGANINAQNLEGQTPFHFAQWEKLGSLLPDLLADKCGKTALHYAAKKSITGKRIETIVKIAELKLLDVKLFVNLKDGSGVTALYRAVKKGNIAACKELLKAGADGNIINGDKGTALHLAAEKGLKDMCKILIDNKVKTNIKNNQSQTPLHIAAKNGQHECCDLLIQKGAVIGETDVEGNTALHHSVQGNHLECTKLLMKMCLEVQKKCKSKVENASKMRNPDLLNILNKKGETPLHIAVEKQLKTCCEILVTENTDLWARSTNGPSPLKLALNFEYTNIFLFLLQNCSFHREHQSNGDIDFKSLLESYLQNAEKDIVEGILKSCYWEESLQPYVEMKEDKTQLKRNENMKTLIEKYPCLAKEVFDECLHFNQMSNCDNADTYSSNKFNLFYIDEMVITSDVKHDLLANRRNVYESIFDNSGKLQSRVKSVPLNHRWQQDHLLSCIIHGQQYQYQLLTHPLIHTWIKYKWSYLRWIHFIFLLLALVVSVLLTTFSIEAWSWQSVSAKWPFNQSVVCSTDKQLVGPRVFKFLEELGTTSLSITYAIYAILGMWSILELYKVIKLRLGYFKRETAAWITTVVASLIFLLNFTNCSRMTYIREDWQWIAGYIAIFSSWILTYYLFSVHPTRSSHLDFRHFFHVAIKILVPALPVTIVVVAIYAMIPDGITAKKYLLNTLQDIYGILTSLGSLLVLIIVAIVLLSMFRFRKEMVDDLELDHSCSASISLILDYEFLYPYLRSKFYRAWVAAVPEANDNTDEIIKMLKGIQSDIMKMKERQEKQTCGAKV